MIGEQTRLLNDVQWRQLWRIILIFEFDFDFEVSECCQKNKTTTNIKPVCEWSQVALHRESTHALATKQQQKQNHETFNLKTHMKTTHKHLILDAATRPIDVCRLVVAMRSNGSQWRANNNNKNKWETKWFESKCSCFTGLSGGDTP